MGAAALQHLVGTFIFSFLWKKCIWHNMSLPCISYQGHLSSQDWTYCITFYYLPVYCTCLSARKDAYDAEVNVSYFGRLICLFSCSTNWVPDLSTELYLSNSQAMCLLEINFCFGSELLILFLFFVFTVNSFYVSPFFPASLKFHPAFTCMTWPHKKNSYCETSRRFQKKFQLEFSMYVS